MKKLVGAIISISIILGLTILCFCIELFSNLEVNFIINAIVILISFIFMMLSIVTLINGKLSFFNYKDKRGSIAILLITTFVLVNCYVITILNYTVAQQYSDSLKGTNKFKYYKIIGENVKKQTLQKVKLTYIKNIKMKKIVYKDLTFYYKDKNDLESVKIIKSAQEKASKDMDDIFGVPKESSVDVLLYHDILDLNREAPDHIVKYMSAYFDSKKTIHMYDYCSNMEEYKETFSHEYSHYRLDNFVKANNISIASIPAWFNEGIATYEELSKQGVYYSPYALNKTLDFTSLDREEDFAKFIGSKNYSPYYQGYFAIDYLIEHYGKDILKDIILKSKYQGFYPSFKAVTGMDINEFKYKYLQEKIEAYEKRNDGLYKFNNN